MTKVNQQWEQLETELRKYADKHLDLKKWEKPVEYRRIKQFPRTEIGKVDYRRLEEIANKNRDIERKSMKTIVRQAKMDDLVELLELYHQLLPKYSYNYEQASRILEEILKDNNYIIFVVESTGKVIATCTLVIIYNLTHNGRSYGIIENVITHEQYRGRGCGKMLIKKVIEYAESLNCHKLMVQTRKKEEYIFSFYRKCGFSDELTRGFILDME